MSEGLTFTLQERIGLNHKGQLTDYASLVSIPNTTNRKITYRYHNAEETYDPARLVRDETLSRLRILPDGTNDYARIAKVGRVMLNEGRNPVDTLFFQFVFDEDKTDLENGEYLRFRTTFQFKEGNLFTSWASAWPAQSAWFEGLEAYGNLSFEHNFELKVPLPGKLMKVSFENQSETPRDKIDLDDSTRLYRWGPLQEGKTLQVTCRYSESIDKKKVAYAAITLGISLVSSVPHP